MINEEETAMIDKQNYININFGDAYIKKDLVSVTYRLQTTVQKE